jgi:tetratricopeptide (TPR) repeat protein
MAARRAVAPVLAALLAACASTGPSSEEAHRALMAEGDAALAAGKRRVAVETFTRAIEQFPDSAEPYYRRGTARLRSVVQGDVADEAGELGRAVDDFGGALQLYPLHFEALYNRALCLAALSRHREAAQDLQQAVQARDIDLRRDAHAKLAALLDEKFLDMEAQALKHYERYAELGGRDSAVLERSVSLRAKMQSASVNPEDEAAARTLIEEARGLLAEGRKDLAGELLTRVTRKFAKTRAATHEAAPLLKDLEGKK